MGIITIVISDELEKEIRRLISMGKVAKKGALSKLIEDALWAYIRPKLYSNQRVFVALKDNKVVAEASSLRELAEKEKRSLSKQIDTLIEAYEKKAQNDNR